uniref:Transposase n=1 Tax=Heterorhabditis bacteriophora TaxID=37862 RepID=A0A1I7XBY9_HETBA
MKRTADDRANGKFRCTWTESLRTARDGFLEPGLWLSALSHFSFGRRVGVILDASEAFGT